MSLSAAVGQSHHVDSQQAGAQAAQQALENLGRPSAEFGLLSISYAHSIRDVLAGVNAVLAETPLLGFSTSAELTGVGKNRRTVVISLLSGDGLYARAGWWPGFARDSRIAVGELFRNMKPNPDEQENLLVVADGSNGDTSHLCQVLSAGRYSLAGWLAGGDPISGRTYQLGGRFGGASGLAAAVLGGDVAVGVGAAHGWQPIGVNITLSDTQGLWVHSLDGQIPSQTYAQLFGYPSTEWISPPLNELVRLYPFGISNGEALEVRSPLRIEPDGSLRMNTPLVSGTTASLMLGDRQACLQAARLAARQALQELGPCKPKLALVVADVAWMALLEMSPGAEIQALQEELGKDIPIIGGYTFGQIARMPDDGRVRLLNQHIEVILFGDKVADTDKSAA